MRKHGYTYCSNSDGIVYPVTATAVKDTYTVVVKKEIRASSVLAAGQEMEEFLEEHLEGFTWQIVIEENDK